jgi:tripartite-type tricarboxylate transporter receptor subunit TctC
MRAIGQRVDDRRPGNIAPCARLPGRWLALQLALSTLALALLAAPRASAQGTFPVKPVRVVVGFATGGANDLFIRALAPEWSAHLGQPVLIDNRPGAAGQIANELVMRAPADGHTLLLGSSSAFTILPNLHRGTPYDPVRDYAPVGTFARASHVLVANTALPARSIPELIALARARPGEINFGSAGNGSILHLDMELFMSMTGVRLTHIPYKGSEPALADLLANRIQLLWATESQVLPQVKLGQLRALAISAIGNGSARYPAVPSMDRAGVKGYDIYNWFGLFAPAGTSAGVIERLNRTLDLALHEPTAISRLDTAGAEPFPGTAQDLARLLASETLKIRALVHSSGLAASE